MSKKITGAVAEDTRRKLASLAARSYNGGIGRATVHVVKLGLENPDHPNTMSKGDAKACSVTVEEHLVEQITEYQVQKGIAKRTEAAKQLIEVGLSVLDGRTKA